MKNIVQMNTVLMMCLAIAACKTNAQYDAGVTNAAASGSATGYASGYTAGQTAGQASGQAGLATEQANAIKAANLMTTLEKQAGASNTFTVVKFGKDNPNYLVVSATGAQNYIFAIDISSYVAGTAWSTFYPSTSFFTHLTDNGNGTYSCTGTCHQSGNGPSSTTMTFEKTEASTKDMEKVAAIAEAYQVETMASNIAAQFGLSDDRSIKIAQLAASWNKLSKTRALTNSDADAFSQELAGVSITDMNNAEQAMADGNTVPLNSILMKAAEVNGTTPENMSTIMMKLFF